MVSGVISEKVFEYGNVVGYDIRNLTTGGSYPVIRLAPFPHSVAVGKYSFDIDGFHRLNDALMHGSIGDVVVLDEIGPAEMNCGSGLLPSLNYFFTRNVTLILVVRERFVAPVVRFCRKNSQAFPARQF
jgi:nucleoside-triphosphatase THEP1